ncbi:MAG: hypothetical protein IPK64_04865 [bacterium]|nr:hypothetical protein [bacterium]
MKKHLLCAVLGLLVAGILPLCALADEPGGLSFKQRGGWTEGHCGAMVVDQRTVYLANGAWLEDIDVTDPALPRVRSRVELSAGIVDLARTQGRVCALTADRALHVVRDDAGRGLQVAGRLDFEHERSASPRGMTVVGPYVYVNDVRSLHIVDITGARQPRVVKSLDSPFAPYAMQAAAATGSTLYLGNSSTTWIFDVSDPLRPIPVRDIGVPGDFLTINDGLLRAATDVSFLLDIADPLAPRQIDVSCWWGSGFAVHDTLLYITDWNVAVYTLDGRSLSWGVTPARDMEELESQGEHLFARQEGLTILGLSDPFAPAVVGRHRTGVGIQDLQFVGDRAYLAGGVGRLTVMDVADPDRPVLLGAWIGPDEPMDPRRKVVSINSGRALVGGIGPEAWVLDVTDPADIRALTPRMRVFEYSAEYYWAFPAGTGWFVSGSPTPNRLSVAADGSTTLTPVDLPEYPCEVRPGVYVGNRRSGDRSPGVWLAEDGGDPQRVADLVAGVEAQTMICRFAASGDIAYGLDLRLYSLQPDTFEVRIVVNAFDLSEPEQPHALGTSVLPLEAAPALLEWGSRVTADGNLLYVWSPYHGEVAVLDARNPSNVVRCGGLWIGNGIVDVAIARDRLVVTTATGGFRTYNRPVLAGLPSAAAPVPMADIALHAAPNPFNPTTRVTFHLALAGQTEVSVFDLLGRRVRRLHAGVLAAGEHAFVWGGIDEAGRAVAAGPYLVRASVGDRVSTAKIMLAK